MNRHRIEIEFDGTAEQAEEFFSHVGSHARAIGRGLYLEHLRSGMTIVAGEAS